MVAAIMFWKCLVALFLCDLTYVNTFNTEDLPRKIRCLDDNCKGMISQAFVKESFDSRDDFLLTTRKNDLLKVLGKDVDDGQLWLVKHFHTGQVGFTSREYLKEVHVLEENPEQIVELETVYHKIVVDKQSDEKEQLNPPPPPDDSPLDAHHDSPSEGAGPPGDTPDPGGSPAAETVPAWQGKTPSVPSSSVEIPNPLGDQAQGENLPGNIEKQDGGGSTINDNVYPGSTDAGQDLKTPSGEENQDGGGEDIDPAFETPDRADDGEPSIGDIMDTPAPGNVQRQEDNSQNLAEEKVEEDEPQIIDPHLGVKEHRREQVGHIISEEGKGDENENLDDGGLPRVDSLHRPVEDSLREAEPAGVTEPRSDISEGGGHLGINTGVNEEDSPPVPERLPEGSSSQGEGVPDEKKDEVVERGEEMEELEDDDTFDYDFFKDDTEEDNDDSFYDEMNTQDTGESTSPEHHQAGWNEGTEEEEVHEIPSTIEIKIHDPQESLESPHENRQSGNHQTAENGDNQIANHAPEASVVKDIHPDTSSQFQGGESVGPEEEGPGAVVMETDDGDDAAIQRQLPNQDLLAPDNFNDPTDKSDAEDLKEIEVPEESKESPQHEERENALGIDAAVESDENDWAKDIEETVTEHTHREIVHSEHSQGEALPPPLQNLDNSRTSQDAKSSVGSSTDSDLKEAGQEEASQEDILGLKEMAMEISAERGTPQVIEVASRGSNQLKSEAEANPEQDRQSNLGIEKNEPLTQRHEDLADAVDETDKAKESREEDLKNEAPSDGGIKSNQFIPSDPIETEVIGGTMEEVEVPTDLKDDGYDSGIGTSTDDEDDPVEPRADEAGQDHSSKDLRQEENGAKDPGLEEIEPTPQFEVIDGTTIFLQDHGDFGFEQEQVEHNRDQLHPSHKGPASHEVTATPPLQQPINKVHQAQEESVVHGHRDQGNPTDTPTETLDDFTPQGKRDDPKKDELKNSPESQGDPEDTFLATADELARANLKFTKWLSQPGSLDVLLDELAADNPEISDDKNRLHMELSRMMNNPEWQKRVMKRLWHLFGDDISTDNLLNPNRPPDDGTKNEEGNPADIVGDPEGAQDIPSGVLDEDADDSNDAGAARDEFTWEEPGEVLEEVAFDLEGTAEPVLVDPYDFSSKEGDTQVKDDGGDDQREASDEDSSTDHPATEVHDTTTQPPAYQTDYPPPLPQDYTPPSQDFAPPTEEQQDYYTPTESTPQHQPSSEDYQLPAEPEEEEEEVNSTYSLDEIMEILMENFHSLYNVTMVTVLPLLDMLPDEMKAALEEPTFLGIPWMTLVWAEAAITGFFALLFCGCICSARSNRACQREMEMEIRSLTAQKKKALDGLKTTTRHFEEQNMEYHQFRQEMKDVDEKNKDLVDMYEALKEEKEKLDKMVAEYEKVSHKQQKELDGFRHKVSHQGDAHSKAQQRIKTLQEETKELKARLSAYENDSVTLKQAVEAKDGEIKQLSESRDELTEEVRKTSHQLDDLVAEVALLKENNESLTSAVTDKNNEIEVLKDCLIQLKGIEDYGEGTEVDNEARISQLLDVNRANAKINLLEEERKKQEEKMEADSMKIHELEDNNKSLRKEVENLQQEFKKAKGDHEEARTKLDVLTEYFKNKEVEMQRKLGKEEALKFHSQKELDTLGEKSAAAEAEVSNYKQQIQDLKDEMEKSERSFRQQVAAHEKKAHESWLASRTAERKLRETNKEVAALRQRLTELQGRKVSDSSPLIKPAPGRMGSPSNASEASMMTRDQPSRNSILEEAPSPPIIGGQRQSPSEMRDRPPSRPLRVSRTGRPPSFHEDYFPPEDMMPPHDMPFPRGPPGPFPPGVDPYGPPPMEGPFPPGMDFDGPPPPGYGPPGPYDFDPHGPPPPFMGPHPDDFGPEGPFPGMDPTMGPPPFRGPPPPGWDDGRMLPPGVRGPPPPGGDPSQMRRPSGGIPPQQGHLDANQGPRTSSPLDSEATDIQNQARQNTRKISQQP